MTIFYKKTEKMIFIHKQKRKEEYLFCQLDFFLFSFSRFLLRFTFNCFYTFSFNVSKSIYFLFYFYFLRKEIYFIRWREWMNETNLIGGGRYDDVESLKQGRSVGAWRVPVAGDDVAQPHNCKHSIESFFQNRWRILVLASLRHKLEIFA